MLCVLQKVWLGYLKKWFSLTLIVVYVNCTDLGIGQPNLKYTMWKFLDFSATQIFREINFGHSVSPKTANLTIWAGQNFEFLKTFVFSKCEIFQKIKIQTCSDCLNGSFWYSKRSKNWFHEKLERQENCQISILWNIHSQKS